MEKSVTLKQIAAILAAQTEAFAKLEAAVEALRASARLPPSPPNHERKPSGLRPAVESEWLPLAHAGRRLGWSPDVVARNAKRLGIRVVQPKAPSRRLMRVYLPDIEAFIAGGGEPLVTAEHVPSPRPFAPTPEARVAPGEIKRRRRRVNGVLVPPPSY